MNVRTPYSGMPPPMPVAQPAPQEPSPRERIARLKTLTRRALAFWKVPLLIIAVGMGLSLYMAMSVKLIYRSECTILFKPQIRTGDRGDENQSDRASRVGAKLKDLLVTRARLEEVIKKFNLYPTIVDSRGIVEAVEEMRTHIGFRARDSETFVISFENEVPDIARQVTASLSDSLINEFANSNLSAAKEAVDFLTKQEQQSAADSEEANKKLATFLTVHPEFALEGKSGAAGTAAGVPTMPNMPKDVPSSMGDPQLAVLIRQRSRLEAELRNNSAAGVAGGGTQTPAPAPPGSDTVARLTVQRDQAAKAAAAAAADLADKRTRLTDQHPDVVSAKVTADAAARQLHQAEVALAMAQAPQGGGGGGNPYDTGIDATVQRRISDLSSAIAARQDALRKSQTAAQAPGADASASTAAAFSETNELVQLETEWQRMLSALKDARLEHDDLKQRLEHAKLSANATEASGTDQMAVIDPAYKPLRPSKGGRSKTAITGGAVTLILALCYAFARVLFSDTIIDSADLEALHVIPVLGVLPKVRPSNPPPPAQTRGPSPPRAGKDMRRVG